MPMPPPSGTAPDLRTAQDFPITVHDEPFAPRGVLASVDIEPSPGAAPGTGSAFDLSGLHEAERALALSMAVVQQAGFIAGRRALRAALRQLSPSDAMAPLLRTSRGAPLLPPGLSGSISHKRTRAIAVAAPSAGGLLGLDLEERPREADLSRPSIASRVLTGPERDRLAGLDPLAHREATLLHFALKEAVYKAIDPHVGRYVRFTEVELEVQAHGGALVRLLLPESSMRGVTIEAHWRFEGRWIIAMARHHRP